jgi:hypothetical protein|tara:strand:- start:247 stop:453 length:207 start_codon:yes stop_codon:yes gene_type:complete
MKIILIILCGLLLTNCSQFALVASGTSMAISHNTYARLYNASDILTVISTDKSIKGHLYNVIVTERKK